MQSVNLTLDETAGGASGIGKACAEQFVALGARVAVTDRNVQAAQEVNLLGRGC